MEEGLVEKEKLLKKYAERNPKDFWQYDVFANAKEDSIVHVDSDGYAKFKLVTTELMIGSTVRVLIDVNASPVQVITSLCKVIEWIAKDGFAWFNAELVRLM